jgi:hypothetical protein
MDATLNTVIANTLSNIYDWKSDNLKNDFIEFVSDKYVIDEGILINIFDDYNSLSPLERDSISFDIHNFITKRLN